MPHSDHHFAIQFFGKPGSRKNGEWILDQDALPMHQPIGKDSEITSHTKEIHKRTKGTDLIPKVIVKIQQLLKCQKVFALILVTNVLIPMRDLCAQNTWAMQNI